MTCPSAIGVTLGDPAGIGPEVVEAALSMVQPHHEVRLYGPLGLVHDMASRFVRVTPVAVSRPQDRITPGMPDHYSMDAAREALVRAVEDLAAGRIGALVTGPLDKRSLTPLGVPGQTEYVARRLGVADFAMMLAGPKLRVCLATTHLALSQVPRALTTRKVATCIELVFRHLKAVEGLERSRIGVLGLNPHASDHGMFGDEEQRIIQPAIESKRSEPGLHIEGPLPADTAFYRAYEGDFDALVAMYHDQGLGPLKLVHFSDAVNVTLGLTRPRLSPDHGPAYQIAGAKKADPTSMMRAIELADRWTLRS